MSIKRCTSFISSYLLLSCISTYSFAFEVVSSKAEDREPEAATGLYSKKVVNGDKFMVAAANPYASEAGFTILEMGGSAVDAAIAVQLVLTLVEPQSSGIGGGSFMLHWNKANKHLTSFDGRETAPKLATPDMFFDKSGQPVRWIDAVIGGRSVGVPGVLHALKTAHDQYGKLPWDTLFKPAIELAENGFVVSPRLEKLVAMQFNPGISQLPEISAYFFPNNQPIKSGSVLKNPALAHVLRSIAQDGISPFYDGWIAKKIVDAVQQSTVSPGRLSLDDMKNYRSKERPALCGFYRVHQLCGMAPPSSGGVAVIQILAQLERFEINKMSPNSVLPIHLFTQSSRLAFADRDKYIADSDFVSVPTQALVSPSYLKSRSELINTKQDMNKALAGEPEGAFAYATGNPYELPSTSHISIVDEAGNAVSMTTSVEMAFGSALMVEGFILNNQLTDFSLSPEIDGEKVANSIEPLKRPRSSMAPMMVFNQVGDLSIVAGSPGGSRIINYVAQTLIAMLDWQLDPQQAIDLPRVSNRNKVTTLEKGTEVTKLASELEAMGHKVAIQDLNSGIQVIQIANGKLLGGADPRREGKVLAH